MKILWFINSSLSKGSYRTFWISVLLKEVSKVENLTLGICYLTEEENVQPFQESGVHYFPVSARKNYFVKIIHRLLHVNKDANNFNDYLTVVDQFKPDLINIYGTEREYAELVPLVKCKCLIHIQGILVPYFQFWTIAHKDNRHVFFASKPLNLLLGIGAFHNYFKMKKNVAREQKMLATLEYVSGRTDWDRHITKALSPKAVYFHIDEVIRDEFFESEWQHASSVHYTFISIIGNDYFKGYDIALRTTALLEQRGLTFKWKIFGLSEKLDSVKMIEKMLHMKRPASIELMGHSDAKGMIEHMKNASLYIHPSKIENSPNSVCEAMLLGMPVVASYTGGVPSLIQEKVSGLLYPNLDFYALTGIILEYLPQAEKLKEMGMNARKSALKRHDKKKIVNDLLQAYKTILHPKTGN